MDILKLRYARGEINGGESRLMNSSRSSSPHRAYPGEADHFIGHEEGLAGAG